MKGTKRGGTWKWRSGEYRQGKEKEKRVEMKGERVDGAEN